MIDTAAGARYYYFYDGLGSVAALSNANNAIIEAYCYDAFGRTKINTAAGPDGNWLTPDGTPAAASGYGNRFMFTGREYDSETDLYSCRARMYSPALGRFLQPDPIGYADSMNLYQYCGNNPINRIDPHGQMWGWVEKVWDWFWGNAPQEVAEEVVEKAADKLYVPDGDWSDTGECAQAAPKLLLPEKIPTGLDEVWDNAKKNLAEGAKECATEGVEKAAKETAQKGIKNCVKETFPDTKELAKRLGISPKDIHRVKDDILSQTRKYTKKIGADNPDIGVDDLGNIVLKNRKTGQTINTGIPLESFAD